MISSRDILSDTPILYGAPYSVYVRSVRLALIEKSVPHTLVPVDVFAPGGPPADHLSRHPFGRIPAFEHGDFRLYEAGAIMRYVDEAFPGPALQPGQAQARARVNQVISILDAYVYPCLVWDIYVERVSKPKRGEASNEDRIRSALPRAATCLAALDAIGEGSPFLAGPALTLADLHAIPMFAYFAQAPEARDLMQGHRALNEWWTRMLDRPSVAATAAYCGA